jgi:hypothetical protein
VPGSFALRLRTALNKTKGLSMTSFQSLFSNLLE